ncbi:MAG TPA: transporter [Pseudolabrys sp.]|nr:transporter [Pseudolabrys sp.]
MATKNKMKIDASYCTARISRAGLVAAGVLIILSNPISTHAQDGFYEVETKYIFGFTGGSGVGLEGEKEFSLETIARIGKADGRYWASETKLEYEFTPNQYVQFELGPLVSTHVIKDVTDLDNRNSLAMSGFFGEMRYLVLERNSSSPLAITLSAEPEWHRIDETSGAHVTNLGLELKVNADLELITNRLFLGSNLLYEIEGTKDPDDIGAGWEKESIGGVSAALSYRIVPSVFVGAEAWYLRHYDGSFFNAFTGDAIFVGPTIYAKLGPKTFMTAAWNAQVSGHEVDLQGSKLNFGEFTRSRAKLKLAVEF